MKLVVYAVLLIVLLAAAAFTFQGINAKPHLDPALAQAPSSPNWALAAPSGASAATTATLETPVWAMDPPSLLALLDKVALNEARTEILEAPGGEFGADDVLAKTYLQRSATVGYPDYVSVRAVPMAGGASLVMYSRSVYGYSDRGVNKARLKRWIAALDAQASRAE